MYHGDDRMAPQPQISPNALPAADLIDAGIHDLARGARSIPALLVSIGAPRLRRLGLEVSRPLASPERALYDLLRDADPDAAHARYNALVRRLVSFERALALQGPHGE